MKRIGEFVEKNSNKIFIVICIIFAFILLYKLGIIPSGLHVDEAGMAYDALSLARNGTDRYLNKFPIYFINYGGGQSALCTYLTALLLKIFDLSSFIIRLPQVILSIIALVCFYKLLKENVNFKMAIRRSHYLCNYASKYNEIKMGIRLLYAYVNDYNCVIFFYA